MRRAMLTRVGAVPISYRTHTIATVGAATSVTVNKPAGTGAGELIRVLLTAQAARTWTVPAGWALVPGTAAGTQTVALYRIADGTEGASFTFTQTGATTVLVAGCVTTVGTHPTTPFDAASFAQAAASPLTLPGVTVTAGTHLDSLAFRVNNTGTLTKPASMTQAFQDNTIQSFACAYETATPGATGTRAWTYAAGGFTVAAGLLCSLRPA